MYKIFQQIDDIRPENVFALSTYTNTRNQGNKLRHRYCKTDLRKHAFSNRVIDKWNKLPKEIKEAPSVNAFKNRLDAYPKMQELFFKFDDRGQN